MMEPCIKDRKFDGGAIHGSADIAAGECDRYEFVLC